MRNLETRVLKTIREHSMIGTGEHVLIAVSGGPDSMALLYCLCHLAPQLQLRLTVAHLNHRLRGAEADADEAFVQESSRSLGLEVVSESCEIAAQAATEKANLEELARRIRYRFLRRTAGRIRADKVAVGHNRNDQAETVLLRLLRGSGSKGISGIHPVIDGTVVRPLLDCSRSDILGYLQEQDIHYREDATNRDTSRTRNRIRHDLIPYLEQHFNPRLIDILAREAGIARSTADYLDRNADTIYRDLRVEIPDGITLPARMLLELHPAMSTLMLRRALMECRGSLKGVSTRHIHDLLHLCHPGRSGRRMRLSGPVIVTRQIEDLVFQKLDVSQGRGFCCALPIPGRCVVEEIGMEFIAQEGDCAGFAPPGRIATGTALLNPELLPRELTVRSRRPGDRYGGERHRKVKKMLIDAGIAENLRGAVPLVVAGDAVVWIPGFRPAESFRARPDSRACVRVVVRAKK